MLLGIIGSGNLGTALAKVLSDKHKVVLYGIESDVISEINSKHTNSRFLPGIKLNKTILAYTDMSSIKNVDIIIIAVPSKFIEVTVRNLKPYYRNQIILSFTKGLSEDGEVMTDVIIKTLHCFPYKVFAVSGPCIAKELAEGKPTLLMIGGRKSISTKLCKLLETDSLLIKTTADKRGIQFLGFYKNIIAILVGVCDGIGLGKNFESSLMTRAYNEFYHLNAKINVKKHTFVSPAGLGDLYVTAMSNHSRNRTFGYLIGQGMTATAAKKKIGQTVEGYDNLLMMRNMDDKDFIDNELVELLFDIIHHKKSKKQITKLMLAYLYKYKFNNLEEFILPFQMH
jgi:glycerol-3-phosphate dehydrogenase (NAD(P)+)